jgi:peptide/nickel transport system permease protein
VKSGSKLDYAATAASQVGVSVPDFWAGIMYILLFSLTWGLLPPSGYVPIGESFTGVAGAPDPAGAHRRLDLGFDHHPVRSFGRDRSAQPGLRPHRTGSRAHRAGDRGKHVLPNAAIPIVTVIGLQLGFLLGGVVVVEVIFAWPGIGRLALDAVESRDYTVLQGAVLYLAAVFLLVNLIVDVLYVVLDPRAEIS